MAQATLSGRQTVRNRNAAIFAVIAILPLLLFFIVLKQPHLVPGYEAAMMLGLSVAIAILGFVWLQQTGKQISALADYVHSVDPRDLRDLEPQEAHHDLAELARIARSFDNVLAELKATRQGDDQRHRQELEFLDVSDIPRDLMPRVKMAAAHEGKSVKEFLLNLVQARLDELEKKGILPKGK